LTDDDLSAHDILLQHRTNVPQMTAKVIDRAAEEYESLKLELDRLRSEALRPHPDEAVIVATAAEAIAELSQAAHKTSEALAKFELLRPRLRVEPGKNGSSSSGGSTSSSNR
jgi:hypothetical protein